MHVDFFIWMCELYSKHSWYRASFYTNTRIWCTLKQTNPWYRHCKAHFHDWKMPEEFVHRFFVILKILFTRCTAFSQCCTHSHAYVFNISTFIVAIYSYETFPIHFFVSSLYTTAKLNRGWQKNNNAIKTKNWKNDKVNQKTK